LSNAICRAYWPTSVTSRILSSSSLRVFTRASRPGEPASPRHSAHGQAHRNCSALYVLRFPSSHVISITWRARSTSTLVGNGSGSCVSVHVDDGQLAERLDGRPRGHLGGDLHEGLRTGRLGTRDDHRGPGVRVFANALFERDRAEERNTEPPGGRLGAAVAEDLVAVSTLRAHVPAHVLDEAQRR